MEHKRTDRATVGDISRRLSQKQPDSRDPIEQMRESLTEYDKNIYQTVNDALTKTTGDFYVIVITKKEPLMDNVLRNYFGWRYSCPTPDYDQAVYHYNSELDSLDFLWVIPSKDACLYLKNNALHVDTEEKKLLGFVLDFADGTLMKRAQTLNGELKG